jgi:adenine-specific DNA-methyltransferase
VPPLGNLNNGVPRKRLYVDDSLGKKLQDVWEFKDPQYPNYPTEKNLDMLKAIVEASSNEGDLVLDCFAGSGTTLIAAQELTRNWIGIDQSPRAIEVAGARFGLSGDLRTAVGYEMLTQTGTVKAAPEIGWLPDTLLQIKEAA